MLRMCCDLIYQAEYLQKHEWILEVGCTGGNGAEFLRHTHTPLWVSEWVYLASAVVMVILNIDQILISWSVRNHDRRFCTDVDRCERGPTYTLEWFPDNTFKPASVYWPMCKMNINWYKILYKCVKRWNSQRTVVILWVFLICELVNVCMPTHH